MGSPQVGDQNCAPCIGRWILYCAWGAGAGGVGSGKEKPYKAIKYPESTFSGQSTSEKTVGPHKCLKPCKNCMSRGGIDPQALLLTFLFLLS